MADKKEGVDFTELALAVDEMRELFRALVAGLVDDGFTDEQARILITSAFATQYKKQEEGS